MAKNNDELPSTAEILEQVRRMHAAAAASESAAGKHASSAWHEQKSAKYRDAADRARNK